MRNFVRRQTESSFNERFLRPHSHGIQMEIVLIIALLVNLMLASIIGSNATSRGMSGFGWGLLTFFVPLLGILVFVAVRQPLLSLNSAIDSSAHPAPVSAQGSPTLRTCPFCAESIKPAAVVCRFCNREVVPFDAANVAQSVEARNPIESNQEAMTRHGITFDGERYHFGAYRYEKYADALAYAKLQASRA